MKRTKMEKGITLIALIITILVLLILAAVSIGTITDNDGILVKAKEAAEEYNRLAAEEQGELDKFEAYLATKGESLNGGNGGSTGTSSGLLNLKVEVSSKDGKSVLIISSDPQRLTAANITDRYTIDVIEYKFFGKTTGIETYEDLYLKCARRLMLDEDLEYAHLEQATGVPNPTTQDVFLYLMSQASQQPDYAELAAVQTPQQLALAVFDFNTYSDVYVNGESVNMGPPNYIFVDRPSSITYEVSANGTYTVVLQNQAFREEVTVVVKN